MPISTKNIERQSPIGMLARHPIVVLPPNVVNLYANVTAAAGNYTSATLATIPGRTAFSNGVAASNICFQFTTATGFTSAMSVGFEISGLDENQEPFSEYFTCVGNAGATQNFYTQSLYSYIRSIRYQTPVPGNVAATAITASGASVSCGTGDGAVPPLNFLIQNPHPNLPLGSWSLILHATSMVAAGGTSYIVPNALFLPDGRGGFRAARVSANFGATPQARLGLIVYGNLDNNSIET